MFDKSLGEGKNNVTQILIIWVLLFNLLLWLKNYNYFWDLIKIDASFFAAMLTVYDISNTFLKLELFLIIINLLIISINIKLSFIYFKKLYKTQNNNYKKSKLKIVFNNLFSFLSFIIILAFTCIGCSLFLFGGLLSTSFLLALPLAGLEVLILSLIILLIIMYNMYKKIKNIYVC
jgi:hypothetical protein